MKMKKEVRKSFGSKPRKQLKRRSLHGDKKTIIRENLINTVATITNSNHQSQTVNVEDKKTKRSKSVDYKFHLRLR